MREAFPTPITASRDPSQVRRRLKVLRPYKETSFVDLLFPAPCTKLMIIGQKRYLIILACFLESLQ